MLEIYIGSLETPEYYFDDNTIYEAPSVQSVSIIGNELSVDTFTPVVSEQRERSTNIAMFRSSDGKGIRLSNGAMYVFDVQESENPSELITIPEWTPVWYYRNGDLVGKFYLRKVKRVGRSKYQLDCVSAVGRLDKMEHGGGLFLATTFGDVLENIMTG